MFYELMMKKKTQVMYATIKGTLTENDGVFSGFSSSNYLALQENLTFSQKTEITLCLTMPSSSLTQINTFLMFGTNYIYIATNRKISAQLRKSGSNHWLDGATALTLGEKYWIKIINDVANNTFELLISTDGINYTRELYSDTYILSEDLGTSNIGARTTTYFTGSISLPNSYIKLGSTKYNLQAVVGYTIVGSPTIVDGVVSGFNNSNYLKIDNAIILSQADDWEIKIKIGTNTGSYILGSNLQNIITCSIGTSSLYLSSNGSSWDIASGVGLSSRIPENSYLRLRFTGTHYILDYSTDNVTWTTCADVTSSSKLSSSLSYLRIGNWGGGGDTTLFTGTIDLKETYIKINNKLWFNGQQG
jgi:hypothetical protein